ncbi:choice-of-anchor A family protein [Microbacterium sp. NPDC012755]|uniref:choice-of-anchor A family protein n=1 Tax=Microbacterium sp. NPDC012755 TaxID=3364184 RepID=UPI0036CEB75B
MMKSNFARPKRAGGAAAVAAVGIAMIAGGAAPAAYAAPLPGGIGAPLGMCTPDGGFPWIDGSAPWQPQVHDAGINTYVGGDLTVTGSAEAEGLVVVGGDMHIDRSFIVGIAIGSDIRPAPGETQLQVGGDVTTADGAVLHVGDTSNPGGAVRIGGSAAPGSIQNSGASLETGLTAPVALDPHGSFQSRVEGWSSALSDETANGVVTVQGAGWVDMELRGTGADELQVFDVTAEQLGSANAIYFRNIRPHAPIVVNVSGGAVSLKANAYDYNDLRAPFGIAMTSPGDGDIAASILWNLEDATTATIGGSTQIPGSFLAPHADAEVIANTNGRMYVGGDLLASGGGNEMHAYPWSGTCGDDPDPGVDAGADADANGADAGADANGADAGADANGAAAGADANGADAGADANGVAAGADAGADANGVHADAGADGASAGVSTAADANAAASAAASATAAATGDASGAHDGALATTGGQASTWLIGGGAVVLLSGVVFFLAARARRVAE